MDFAAVAPGFLIVIAIYGLALFLVIRLVNGVWRAAKALESIASSLNRLDSQTDIQNPGA